MPPSSLLRPLALAGAGLLAGQWLISDVMHVPGGGLGLLAAGGVVIWLGRKPSQPRFTAPVSLAGWLARCQEVLDQFARFEQQPSADLARRAELKRVLDRCGPVRMAMVALGGSQGPNEADLSSSLAGPAPVTLSLCHPLTTDDGSRSWPGGLLDQDLILFSLQAPLLASDLLWLQQVPDDQPAWLLVSTDAKDASTDAVAAVRDDLPERWRERILVQESSMQLRTALAPLRRSLKQAAVETRPRLLADLHRRWQRDLESLRRERFLQIQQRTQWVVAGSVMASPIASLDLLAVAVANGFDDQGDGRDLGNIAATGCAEGSGGAAGSGGPCPGRGGVDRTDLAWAGQGGWGELADRRFNAGPQCGLPHPCGGTLHGGLAGDQCRR